MHPIRLWLFFLALLPISSWADPPAPETRTFNRLKSPQTAFSPIGLQAERILNGGVGNGIAAAYFCSGKDEVAAWRRRNDRFINTFSANDPVTANQGTYQCTMIKNRCRTEGGCGDIQPDGKCMVVCSPHYATNCYPLGKHQAWDDPLYAASSLSGNPQGGNPALPTTINHTGWAGRNFMGNGDFLYGRYLIDQIDCPATNPTGVSIAPQLEVRIPNQNQDYQLGVPGAKYVDLPYSHPQLKWFACNTLARQGEYKTNINFGPYFPNEATTPMDQERKDHYKTLLALVRNQWGKQVAEGALGNIYSVSNPAEKEMKKIASQIFTILDQAVDLMPGSCGNQECGSPSRGSRAALVCGNTTNETIWEYREETNKLVLQNYLCGDVQTKRTSKSHAHYNIGATNNPAIHGGASYGEWRDATPDSLEEGIVDEGIFEPLFGTVRGVNLVLRNVGGRDEEDLVGVYGGYVPAKGYSPLVIAKLAHEWVHIINRMNLGKNQLAGWPSSPEALYEEELAVMTESIVYSILCQHGFCPADYDMKKTDFIITSANMSRGDRFAYPDECRGERGIFLGPLCANLLNIAGHLKEGRVEIARMMSLWHTSAPLLKPPAQMTLNGQFCGFSLNSECPPLPGSQPNPSPRRSSQGGTQIVTPPNKGGEAATKPSNTPKPPKAKDGGTSAPIIQPGGGKKP